MTSWHSYPKIYNIGHPQIRELFDDDVIVEEKIDGSQFSFGLFYEPEGPVLRCRSKGQELNVDAPEKLFVKAVDVVKGLVADLTPNWTYRCEYLQKPKHNALTYDRIPKQHLIVFDIATAEEDYLPYSYKSSEAQRLGLECVPWLLVGKIEAPSQLHDLLDKTSILGGQKIEGVVVKNYKRFGADKKVLMGKHVSEAFKEVHRHEWRQSNPAPGDIKTTLIAKYRTPARWAKAVQHLRDAGKLLGEPKDIAALIKEASRDLEEECGAEIREELWRWASSHILRGANAGLAEWYKQQLLDVAFK